MKRRSTRSVIAAVLLLSLPLIGCVNGSSARKESLQIFQPPSLHLKANQPVQTSSGIYVPQTDETWHSDARFKQLEAELLNTVAALAQANRK